MITIDSFEGLILEFFLSFEVVWSTDVYIFRLHFVIVLNMLISP